MEQLFEHNRSVSQAEQAEVSQQEPTVSLSLSGEQSLSSIPESAIELDEEEFEEELIIEDFTIDGICGVY
uniref:Mycofactocin n=1 Tax=Thermogemmatispora argillosa TaxID=2045280 RepID=A0A455T7L0_9CHLR|nr:hypothetical protein KTA_36360 [Thermogemmatispora argillosa]